MSSHVSAHVRPPRRGIVAYSKRAAGDVPATDVHRFSKRWFEAAGHKAIRGIAHHVSSVARLASTAIALPQRAAPSTASAPLGAAEHWMQEIKSQRHQDRLWRYAGAESAPAGGGAPPVQTASKRCAMPTRPARLSGHLFTSGSRWRRANMLRDLTAPCAVCAVLHWRARARACCRYCRLVTDINALEPEMRLLTDAQLKGKTCAETPPPPPPPPLPLPRCLVVVPATEKLSLFLLVFTA